MSSIGIFISGENKNINVNRLSECVCGCKEREKFMIVIWHIFGRSEKLSEIKQPLQQLYKLYLIEALQYVRCDLISHCSFT